MAKQIKVGVVGCGYWGPNLVRNFRSLPDCDMKMMCDLSEKRLTHLRSLYPEVEGSADYGHMLNGINLMPSSSPRPSNHIFRWPKKVCWRASILSLKSPWP